jgi:hypothetical protein
VNKSGPLLKRFQSGGSGACYSPPGAKLAAFLQSDHRLRAIVGPVYASRKSAAVFDIMQRAVRWSQQRAWHWVVVRQHRDELKTHTVRAVQHWVRDGVCDAKKRRYTYLYNFGDAIQRLLEIEFLANGRGRRSPAPAQHRGLRGLAR